MVVLAAALPGCGGAGGTADRDAGAAGRGPRDASFVPVDGSFSIRPKLPSIAPPGSMSPGPVEVASFSGVTIAAAGDISCGTCRQADTAALLLDLLAADGLAAILPLGDNAYQHGTLQEFQAHYAPSWGRPELLAITHPVLGNHEYAGGSNGQGHFDYFNGPGVQHGRAGERGAGYYSYDLGDWHLVALNSSDGCRFVPCARGSPQYQWLIDDLARNTRRCTLAYWHEPRFQAGVVHSDSSAVAELWNALVAAGVDVVLNGHEHNFQQLAPLNENGTVDTARGIRSFVVGTGGAENLYEQLTGPQSGALELALTDRHGVLEMVLLPESYEWRFVAVGQGPVPEASGSAACH